MPRSSARGYVEPLAAIAAVFAAVAGLTIYAGAADEVLGPSERDVAETVMEELVRDSREAGVVRPDRLTDVESPRGWQVNVTLATPADRDTWGPVPPESADRARRQIAVKLGPGSIRPGRLTVVAWR